MDTCHILNCTISDIYPEIEMYDKGFSIPKTQIKSQDDDINIINNNYYFSSIFAKFFSDIKILDINEKASLFIKIAIFIGIIDYLFYIPFRMLGKTFPPFLPGDHLSQLIWTWMVFTWPLSLVLPLIMRYWLVYIIPLFTFEGAIGIIHNLATVNMLHNHNQIATQKVWMIHFILGLIITIFYAKLINKFFRKSVNQ